MKSITLTDVPKTIEISWVVNFYVFVEELQKHNIEVDLLEHSFDELSPEMKKSYLDSFNIKKEDLINI